MPKPLPPLFLLFLGWSAAHSQTSADLSFCIANLRNDSLSETALFIQKGETDWYLVTSAQVARTMDARTFVTIQSREENLPLRFPVQDFANPVQWKYHPFADLAVLKLNPRPIFFNKYLLNRFLPASAIDSSYLPVAKDRPLTIMGYLTGWDVQNAAPTGYTTYAVSGFINLEIEDQVGNQAIIVLQRLKVSNFAGGPVFLSPGKPDDTTPPRLLGFLQHGDIRENSGRPVTVMTPAIYLYDLLR